MIIEPIKPARYPAQKQRCRAQSGPEQRIEVGAQQCKQQQRQQAKRLCYPETPAKVGQGPAQRQWHFAFATQAVNGGSTLGGGFGRDAKNALALDDMALLDYRNDVRVQPERGAVLACELQHSHPGFAFADSAPEVLDRPLRHFGMAQCLQQLTAQ